MINNDKIMENKGQGKIKKRRKKGFYLMGIII